MKFSEKLMNLRKSKGWSQDEFAQKINVTRQTVSKWELDQTVPDMNKLMEMSKLFEITLDELVNNIETSNSETTYKESPAEKNNRKIALKILIIGIIISCIIFGIGWIKQKQAIKTNEQAYNNAYSSSQTKVDNAQKRLNEIIEDMNNLKEQINSMEIEIANMRNERQKIFTEDRGFSDRYYAKDNEITVKESELSNLKTRYNNLDSEGYKLQNDNYTVYYDIVEPIKYMIFYYIGAGVVGFTILISLIYFLVTRRK